MTGGGISNPEDLADFFEERAAHLEFDCEIDPQPWIGAQILYTRRQAERQALDEARAQCVPELAARIDCRIAGGGSRRTPRVSAVTAPIRSR